MPITIFYAWQSDRDQDICHYLIRDAAKDAIKAVNAKLKTDAVVEEAPPFPVMVLDHDTKGVPGIPKVAETIQKKITNCDVFLADVTHVAAYTAADGREKKGQNGNVLLELGQALSEKPPERILLVMNTAFGSFDALPFDLHQHRKPLPYHLPVASDKDRLKAAKKALTGKFVEALELMMSDIAAREGATKAKLDAEAMERHRVKALGIGSEFENQVKQNEFHYFRAQAPAMTLCMVPLIPLGVNLDLGRREHDIAPHLAPFSGGGWDVDHDAEHYMIFLPLIGPPGDRSSTSLTAIRQDCCIFSADLIRLKDARWYDQVRHQLEWEAQERKVVQRVGSYLNLMRELGVRGPIFLRLSLVNVANVVLVDDRHGFIDRPRLNERDQILPPHIEVPAEFDGKDLLAVVNVLRTIFDHVWRAAGARNDPHYDSTGQYSM